MLVEVSVQVQDAVDDVAGHFAVERFALQPCLLLGRLDTHDDLAVCEGDHIRRPRNAQELPMELCNPSVRDQRNLDGFELTENRVSTANIRQARRTRGGGQFSQTFQIGRDPALTVEKLSPHGKG